MCSAAVLTPYGKVGVVDEQRMFDSRTSPSRSGTWPPRPLDVVGVNGPTGDGGDRVLELGGLVETVRVERDGDAGRLGEPERRVDELRVRPVVLVDLEAHRAGVDQGLVVGCRLRAGTRLEADVHRPVAQ